MNKIAKFEKVSYEQFHEDMKRLFPNASDDISGEYFKFYNTVTIPKRSSKGSAGYDFVSPIGFTLQHGDSIVIPTGIRCKMDEDWVLSIYPRSGLGFKTHVRLANSVGIIDASYYYTDNEGHIMVKLVADKPIEVNPGDRFCQGIFTQYGITEDDDVTEERIGGLGSSGK